MSILFSKSISVKLHGPSILHIAVSQTMHAIVLLLESEQKFYMQTLKEDDILDMSGCQITTLDEMFTTFSQAFSTYDHCEFEIEKKPVDDEAEPEEPVKIEYSHLKIKDPKIESESFSFELEEDYNSFGKNNYIFKLNRVADHSQAELYYKRILAQQELTAKNTPPKPKEFKLIWKPINLLNDPLPKNFVVGGTSSTGETLAIGRVKHLTFNVCGYIQPSLKICSVPYAGAEQKYSTCEILCCTDKTKIAWIPSQNGTVPPNAVSQGEQEPGRIIYICKANFNGQILPGKVDTTNAAAYVSCNGVEQVVSNYEVLTKLA